MADTSPFTVEERLAAMLWYHESRTTNKTMKRAQEDFEERFGKPAPSKSNLHIWRGGRHFRLEVYLTASAADDQNFVICGFKV